MSEPSFYRVSVKALVKNKAGDILLARQSNNKWELLGGGLDHGETPEEGLTREVYEEAGLRVLSIAPKPSYFLTVFSHSKNVYLANVIYEVQLENLDFRPSDECLELRYVSIDEAAKLELHANVRRLLEIMSAS